MTLSIQMRLVCQLVKTNERHKIKGRQQDDQHTHCDALYTDWIP